MKVNGKRTAKLLRVALPTEFLTQVEKTDGCWNWIGRLSTDGYGAIGRREAAHRAAWKYTHGPIPPGLHVLHTCDNRRCVRPSHLFLGTPQDNTDDMFSKDRQPSKIGREAVEAIRALSGMTSLQIRKRLRLPISSGQVGKIRRGECWK